MTSAPASDGLEVGDEGRSPSYVEMRRDGETGVGTNVEVEVEVTVFSSRYPGAECRGREGPDKATAAKNLLVDGFVFDLPGDR